MTLKQHLKIIRKSSPNELSLVRHFLQMQSIPLQKQVDYYSQVHETLRQQIEASSLEKHLSKSIFIVVIGGNDVFGYFDSKDLQNKNTPQQYADSMASTLKLQLQVNDMVVKSKQQLSV